MDLTILCSAKPLDGALDLDSLTFKVTNLVHDLLRLQSLLEIRRVGRTFAADKVTDFMQGETELLSTQNHLDAHAISCAIQPGSTFPPRLNESSILIKPQGTKANVIQPRHLAYGQLILFRFGSGVRSPRLAACGRTGQMTYNRPLAHMLFPSLPVSVPNQVIRFAL